MSAMIERGTVAVQESAESIRVRGLVQGVGFRPTIWRLAQRHGLRGWVSNDGDGVDIQVCGVSAEVEAFVHALSAEAPPLSRIDSIERSPASRLPTDVQFQIRTSNATGARTGVVPDAASCPECVKEALDPFQRRYRYPFTNCTHCGPRLSIIEGIPYDRAATTMRVFPMCADCQAEYEHPQDRRFHAQPVACHACGPHAWLERADGAAIAIDTLTTLDQVDAVCSLLQRGDIVAIKGLGGFQLACDATKSGSVSRLRQLKRRERKPFALMARDLDVIRRYCVVSTEEQALLESPAAPIVILQVRPDQAVAADVAPGIATLGFMLPNTPLHHLMLRRMTRPIVLTSGNLSDEPQCIANAEALTRLGGIAEYFLMHDRDIARRVDDSVARVVAGEPRLLRRARGYAPASLPLPPGFEAAPSVLALGAELKNCFCLLRAGEDDAHAILSHHMGDLENAATCADYRRSIDAYLKLFEYTPLRIAIDRHPEYLSSKFGQEMACQQSLPLTSVQHHHAHVAACLAENAVPLDAAPVIGVALDGLGYGNDGTLWGGEFFLTDYRDCKRLGTFKPVAMPGGAACMHEPWRNAYAHLMAEMGWPRFAINYESTALYQFLNAQPRALIDSMIKGDVNSPLASSCGRLFDAAAAAAGVCTECTFYEGQAAIEFEALVDVATLDDDGIESAYPFAIPRLKGSNLPYIEPLPMWQALLGDVVLGTPVPVIAARFHKGLAAVIVRMIEKLSQYESGDDPVTTVALSGGVFQNRVLFEQVKTRLDSMGFQVLTHRLVPCNDGGLALGQAVIAAAQQIH